MLVVTLSEPEIAAMNERTMQQSLEIIRRRVDETGTREPSIQRQGADRILIQVPGIGSAEELLAVIGQTARLSFHPVVSRTTDAAARPGPRRGDLPQRRRAGRVLRARARARWSPASSWSTASRASTRTASRRSTSASTRRAARRFGGYTAENIGSPFAIVLDDEVISAPVIQSHIPGGSGIITGNFTPEESTRLAILLRAGALPAEITVLEQRTIGPELGADSIAAGAMSALAWRSSASSASWSRPTACSACSPRSALVMNIVLLIALMTVLGATLTMPGIAGLVLTIGMAVDANVLIFERIREELRRRRAARRGRSSSASTRRSRRSSTAT